MSLFDLIRYPVTKDTTDYHHIPDNIWEEYIIERSKLSTIGIDQENKTNAILIRVILEWNES